MEFANLGNSGLKVSRIILGGMSFGSSSWRKWVLEDEEKIFELLKYAYDNGIRTWDTADVYSNGESERLIGKFLKKFNINRSTVTILSKCYMPVDDDLEIESNPTNFMNRRGLSRKRIFDAVEASVERLGTYIDVLQIHRYDHETPIEETMEALHDVVKQGKVRYIGASSMRAFEFIEMQHVAEIRGWTKFISMQNFHNLLYREEEREMIPYCKKTGVGLIPWSPIARGVLARPLGQTSLRYETDPGIEGANMDKPESNRTILKRVEEVAAKKGISMAQVAIAWSLGKGFNPIVGFSKTERIDEAIAAISVKLTEEEIKYLEEPYEPLKVFGTGVAGAPQTHVIRATK